MSVSITFLEQIMTQTFFPQYPELSGLSGALLNIHPPEILDYPGRFLYSGVSTLRQKGEKEKYYLLGHNPGVNLKDYENPAGDTLPNPGGKPKKKYPSLRKDIIKTTERRDDYCAYIDEDDWNPPSKMQPGVRALGKAIGIDPRKMCASNLFFERSTEKKYIKWRDPKIYWPVHEAVLKLVNPDCIFFMGAIGFESLIGLLNSSSEGSSDFVLKESRESGHANWMCHFAEGHYLKKKLKVINFPDLSRYSLSSNPAVQKWIVEKLRGK